MENLKGIITVDQKANVIWRFSSWKNIIVNLSLNISINVNIIIK